jgi:hypothetical protein
MARQELSAGSSFDELKYSLRSLGANGMAARARKIYIVLNPVPSGRPPLLGNARAVSHTRRLHNRACMELRAPSHRTQPTSDEPGTSQRLPRTLASPAAA